MKLKTLLATNFLTIIFFIILGYVSYLYFVPVKIYDRTVEQFAVVNEDKQVRAGEAVRYKVDVCKIRDSLGHISVQLVNGRAMNLREYSSNLGPGCYNLIQSVIIPEDQEPGPHTLEISVEHQPNILRTQVEKFLVEEFEVLPAGPELSSAQ